MMRATLLAIALAFAAGPIAAQQTQYIDEAPTVPQSRFDAEAGAEAGAESGAETGTTRQDRATTAGPRFVPAPGSSGIEVTPLPPPGGVASPRAPGADDGSAPADAPAADGLPRRPGQGEPAEDRSGDGPGTGMALIRPGGEAIPVRPPQREPRPGVRLRMLDKIAGETETFEIAVGETQQVERLTVMLEACRSPGSNDIHGTIAFLKVWDDRMPEAEPHSSGAEVFSGWMFAQSPSLSAMDHARYDLWVISCTTSDGAVSSASK